MIIGGRM